MNNERPVMTRPDREREAFEAWLLEKRLSTWWSPPSNPRPMPAHWSEGFTHHRREGWEAGVAWARAALPTTVALPPLPVHPNEGTGDEWDDEEEAAIRAYARAAIEAASRGTGDAWISVEDRLPEPRAYVLAWFADVEELLYYAGERLWYTDGYVKPRLMPQVTHWMPLPAPPVARDAAQGADRG